MPRKKHYRDFAIGRYCFSNDLDDKIADDEQGVRKVTASEALDSVDAAKCFAGIHGDKQMNVMLNE